MKTFLNREYTITQGQLLLMLAVTLFMLTSLFALSARCIRLDKANAAWARGCGK